MTVSNAAWLCRHVGRYVNLHLTFNCVQELSNILELKLCCLSKLLIPFDMLAGT